MDENRLVMEMEDFRHLLFGYLNFGFMLLQFGGNFNLVEISIWLSILSVAGLVLHDLTLLGECLPFT